MTNPVKIARSLSALAELLVYLAPSVFRSLTIGSYSLTVFVHIVLITSLSSATRLLLMEIDSSNRIISTTIMSKQCDRSVVSASSLDQSTRRRQIPAFGRKFILALLIIIRQFIRRRSMAKVTTKAPPQWGR